MTEHDALGTLDRDGRATHDDEWSLSFRPTLLSPAILVTSKPPTKFLDDTKPAVSVYVASSYPCVVRL
jgi:hypothetical protein